MAFVEMQKVRLYGLKSDQAEIVDLLARMSVMEIRASGIEAENIASPQKYTKLLSELDGALQFFARATKKGKDEKKQLFPMRRQLTRDELADIASHEDSIMEAVYRVRSIEKEIISLNASITRNKAALVQLQPWQSFETDLSQLGETRFSVSMIGVLPSSACSALDDIKAKYTGLNIDIINQTKEGYYIYIIAHKDDFEAVNELSALGFTQAALPETDGTPSQIIKNIFGRIKDLNTRIKDLIKEATELRKKIPEMQALYDHYIHLQAKDEAVSRFLTTDKVFMITGWIPSHEFDNLNQSLLTISESVFLEKTEPDEGEITPTLLKEKKIVEPFESVTNMYSAPLYGDIDPNSIMMPFFFVSYGIMMSDAGYGLLLTLACLIGIKLMRPQKGTLSLMKLLVLTGISTMIWGVLFNGFFGMPIFEKALLLNPTSEPMNLLILSLGFGVLQIFVGMGVNFYMIAKQGRWLDAVLDVGMWFFLLVGLLMMILGMVMNGLLTTIGTVLAVIGAAGIIFTHGRAKKGLFKKLGGGLGSIYNITGYISDILSYSRLLGLGMATGAVASVINTMAGMLFNVSGFASIIFTPAAVLVLIIGHVANLAINALGAYVHSSRLQFIEFYGKFYEGGGVLFSPLGEDSKYIEIVKKH